MIVGDLMSKGNPARQLLIFSGMAITALLIGIFASGMISVLRIYQRRPLLLHPLALRVHPGRHRPRKAHQRRL